MARKFGGAFSPGGKGKPAPAPRAAKPAKPRAGFRARLMFLAPLALVFRGFGATTSGDVGAMARYFGAFALLILGAWLLREGLKADAAFAARKHARRPSFPRKIFAAVLAGLGIALAVWGDTGAPQAVATGVLGVILHLLAFGIDPLKSKGVAEANDLGGRRVLRAVTEAEAHIAAMTETLARLDDRKLSARLAALTSSAEAMIRTVEDDPRDLLSARKYLGVYLMGARDATRKFVDLYEKTRDAERRADYENLIADLETNFEAQRKTLLEDDREDLDIEIDVLRDRLRYEGVKS